MSVQLIRQYHTQIEKVVRYGGSQNESTIRKPFQDLLEHYARTHNLELIAELDYRASTGKIVRPDGTLKDALRQDWGYWESKDKYDELEVELEKKFAKGYPNNNILFEDGQTAILYQAGQEVARADFQDATALDKLLTRFVSYESNELREFREAIEHFAEEVPSLSKELRVIINEQAKSNLKFQQTAQDFLELCKEAINPALEMADIREMIIQHVLTQDIFTKIFTDAQFLQENNIANSLGQVVNSFYKGKTRRNINDRLGRYYATINARAAQIYNHHEKQKFLKALYENFYKAYNPKGADRLGIVYTPSEIVDFMIKAADYLTFKHFGKTLGDKGVEILDPATGTGTFITELIEYIPKHQLEYKYKNEIHCNEVAILPYYIANLNIEYTYHQKMGSYEEFENIVFVDTLDNLGFTYNGKQTNFFHLTDENTERIKRQNQCDISVIIGNPPYNANQLNENENNKNREYPFIDERIKETYIKHSSAQKTKLYDMYARFYRWASDRLADNGIVAFVTNRSFIDARTYDGFRKVIAEEFTHIYVIDLGGDVRKNPNLSGPKNNVFAIQTGVAICILVKKDTVDDLPCRILYVRRPEMELAADKLSFLTTTYFRDLQFISIRPDKQNNWLNLIENSWDDLLPVGTREAKLAKNSINHHKVIFKLFSLGVGTARDEWVYDFNRVNLKKKVRFFHKTYRNEIQRWHKSDKKISVNNFVDRTIKWTSELEAYMVKGTKLKYALKYIRVSIYRPFVKQQLYFDRIIVHRLYQQADIFGVGEQSDNILICFSGTSSSKPFQSLAVNHIPSLDFLEKTQCLPLYRYDSDGNRVENITDYALAQFQAHYGYEITKLDIFHYVYAVLHNPSYREKYKLNLKREFPHIPFYDDFWQWADWGNQLMGLHLDYEIVPLYPLVCTDKEPTDMSKVAKAKLKAVKEDGVIELDSLTTLSCIPPEAWEYRLGNRSALEWVLERYKERKPRDPTIREKFDNYHFADYKKQVIQLLQRVCTVSVETMKIVKAMSLIKV